MEFDEPKRSLLNKHVFFDRVMLGIAGLFVMNKKYFQESIESPTFEEHLKGVTLDFPHFRGEGLYELEVETLAGEMDAAFRIAQWKGTDAPTVLYHHGASEHPFDKSFKKIFPPDQPVDANLIVIRSPYHRTSNTELMKAGVHLSRYVALMAVSVAVTERLLSLVNKTAGTLVAGYSLGGFITNRHHMQYNTAGAYVPFMAGTVHGEIFLTTWKAAPQAVEHAEVLRDRLNFDKEWAARSHNNVFPVLGLYDPLNLIETQGPSYGDVSVEVWKTGHLSSTFACEKWREKILRHLPGLEEPV